MPTFKHDCNGCKFISSAIIMGRLYDFYYCQPDKVRSDLDVTLLARYSDEGSHYSSADLMTARRSIDTWPLMKYAVEQYNKH